MTFGENSGGDLLLFCRVSLGTVINCVDAVDAKHVGVNVGMGWWFVLVHTQSVLGVGNVWIPKSRGVKVVVAELLCGAAGAPRVSVRVVRSWGGYIWSGDHSVARGEDRLE